MIRNKAEIWGVFFFLMNKSIKERRRKEEGEEGSPDKNW